MGIFAKLDTIIDGSNNIESGKNSILNLKKMIGLSEIEKIKDVKDVVLKENINLYGNLIKESLKTYANVIKESDDREYKRIVELIK
jgi:hypothetical protein